MSSDDLHISLTIDKKPYIKNLSMEPIINLTGEAGSGKSFYAQQYMNDPNYIVIDTETIFERFDKATGINKEYGDYIRNKYDVLPDLFDDFDTCYKDILEYFEGCGKTIVIDSLSFKIMKNVNLLRGKLIVMRTSVDTCYRRCVERFKENHPYATQEEIDNYARRKKELYKWYLELNDFLDKVDRI